MRALFSVDLSRPCFQFYPQEVLADVLRDAARQVLGLDLRPLSAVEVMQRNPPVTLFDDAGRELGRLEFIED
ncbi:hypothetical protein [Trichloromonas sp.]|uniref:hypothetical protein n=1 Tax=Trichloromonas sp. TaxID=3069249 RepID=UPI002A3A3CD8|nr:hypothetical protein [Trichloromonas sp.]